MTQVDIPIRPPIAERTYRRSDTFAADNDFWKESTTGEGLLLIKTHQGNARVSEALELFCTSQFSDC